MRCGTWPRTISPKSPTFRTWSYLTAIALVAAPVLGVLARFGDLPDLLSALVAAILVPVWSIWLGRSIEGSRASAPA